MSRHYLGGSATACGARQLWRRRRAAGPLSDAPGRDKARTTWSAIGWLDVAQARRKARTESGRRDAATREAHEHGARRNGIRRAAGAVTPSYLSGAERCCTPSQLSGGGKYRNAHDRRGDCLSKFGEAFARRVGRRGGGKLGHGIGLWRSAVGDGGVVERSGLESRRADGTGSLWRHFGGTRRRTEGDTGSGDTELAVVRGGNWRSFLWGQRSGARFDARW